MITHESSLHKAESPSWSHGCRLQGVWALFIYQRLLWQCRRFSLADIVYTPALERLGANLPVMRSFPLRHHPSYPHIAEWFAALDKRPAYQRVKSDDMTHNLVFRCSHRG